jgi:hypothetical protein
MDRREFAASLSDDQREFIKNMRDSHINAARLDVECYKDYGKKHYFDTLEVNIVAAQSFNFLLNEKLPDSYRSVYADYREIFCQREAGK